MKKHFSLLLNIFQMKCPRCRADFLFKNRITLHPSRILAMKESCSICGLKYMVEPSFYFGAMYVAYAISVLVALFVFILGSKFFQWEIGLNLLLVFSVLVFATPFQLKLSRSIWLHIFVQYNPSKR